MNTELTHITDWFRANKLSLNVSKTNYMLFSSKTPNHQNHISIDNNNISQVHTTKCLGITIDDKLTWNHHIDNITTKASHATGTIYRVRHHLPQRILKSLYNTLVLPHFSYCNIIMGFELSNTTNKTKHYSEMGNSDHHQLIQVHSRSSPLSQTKYTYHY